MKSQALVKGDIFGHELICEQAHRRAFRIGGQNFGVLHQQSAITVFLMTRTDGDIHYQKAVRLDACFNEADQDVLVVSKSKR